MNRDDMADDESRSISIISTCETEDSDGAEFGRARVQDVGSLEYGYAQRNEGWREPGAADNRVWGRRLRRVSLAILLRAGRPLSVSEVLFAIEAWGYVVDSSYPRKAVADALAYEHDRGWARRTARGVYREGTISRSSRWRLLHHRH